MDIISTRQLNLYDEILEEINREFEKSEKLKKEIGKADDKIIALKLSASSCKQKISHVNIKVFDSLSEIYNLYDSEIEHCDLQALSQHFSCNFYLIEVILTQCLLLKLLDSQWKIQIRVNYNTGSVCKVIKLTNKTPITEIIPVDCNVRECTVESCLFLQSGNNWNIIDMHTVNVDISFYFHGLKEQSSSGDLSEHILNIAKLYNRELVLKFIQSPVQVQSHFKCSGDENNLVSNIVKNSYHRLDLELFSEFSNESKNIVEIQFCVSGKKLIVLYNKGSNILKAKCCSREILDIKKFFIKHAIFEYSRFKKKLKDINHKKEDLRYMNSPEVHLLYKELRKLWI